MQSGKGDVFQLTAQYIVLAQCLRPIMARHQLPHEVTALREIESQLGDVKEALSFSSNLDDLTLNRM